MDIQKLEINHKVFLSRYCLIRREKNLQFGEYQLMKDKVTKQNVIVKNHNFKSQEEIDQVECSLFQTQILNECYELVSLLAFSKVQEQDNSISFQLIYEHPGKTLEQELLKKFKSETSFDEDFLWCFIQYSINALEFLQEKDIAHQDLNPKNYFVFPDDLGTGFKILYTNYSIPSFQQIVNFKEPYANYFLSPEQADLISQHNFFDEHIDKLKSDVFCLGSILLHIGSVQGFNNVYRINDYSLNTETLKYKLDIFHKIYSQQLNQMLELMLNIVPSQRPNFIELKQHCFYLQQQRFLQKAAKTSIQQKQIKINKNNSLSVQNVLNFTPKRNIGQKKQNNLRTPSPNRLTQTVQRKLKQDSIERETQKRMPLSEQSIRKRQFQSPNQWSDSLAENKLSIFEKVHSNLKEELEIQREQFNYRMKNFTPTRNKYSPQKSVQSNGTTPRTNVQKKTTSEHFSSIQENTKNPIQSQIQEKQPNQQNASSYKQFKEEITQKLYDQNGLYKPGFLEKKYVDGSFYIGQMIGDQREGEGVYFYQTGEIYAGQWSNNKLHGFGVYLFLNGEKYEGKIEDGKKQGQGTYYYSNGNIYKGQWRNDKKNGLGEFIISSKNEEYQGEFFEGFKHGKGTYKYSNGDQFQGYFEKNLKQGTGQVLYQNGSNFYGFWNKDYANGEGKCVLQNGDVYMGNFCNGLRQGQGQYFHTQLNAQYLGEWKNDEPNGKGKYIYQNKEFYEGDVVNGQRHGYGTYSYKNGDIYYGEWKFNLKQGQGKMEFFDGSFYEGEWENNLFHGDGEMKYYNGDSYNGNWAYGQRNGKGVFNWIEEGIYNGDWDQGNMHGEGTHISKSGNIQRGKWSNNVYISDD